MQPEQMNDKQSSVWNSRERGELGSVWTVQRSMSILEASEIHSLPANSPDSTDTGE